MRLPFFKNTLCIASSLLIAISGLQAADEEYNLHFSTYLGGSGWEHARDLVTDSQGNVIVVGGTQSTDFPVPNGYQTTQDQTGTDLKTYSGKGYIGYCDAFISKFSPDGHLLWSTYLGGPNYDRAYAVEIDQHGNIYVAGRAGLGFPTTASAFQPEPIMDLAINANTGFVAKLAPDGSTLWSSYVGSNHSCRDIDVDVNGDVYLPINYKGIGPLPDPNWFTGSYSSTLGSQEDVGVIKVSSDGTTVHWATWIRGNDVDSLNAAVQVDANQNVFLSFTTRSTDLPATNGTSHQGFNDAFIAKFSPDGKNLLAGTYFGGNGYEAGNTTHSFALNDQGQAFLSSNTSSTNLPSTDGSSFNGGQNDVFVARFSNDLNLEKCTYFGGSLAEGTDGIEIDADGNVYISAQTESTNIPTTPLAYQKDLSPAGSDTFDVLFVKFNPDLDQVLYASYMGGPQYDFGRAMCLDDAGNWFISGSSNGAGWPVKGTGNPEYIYQSNFAGGNGTNGHGGSHAGDVILAKFTPNTVLANQAPQVDLGADQSANINDTLNLHPIISDDGLPGNSLNYQWQQISGPDTLTISQPLSANTDISAPSAGTYVVELQVSDGELSSSDSITLTIDDLSNEPFAHWKFDEMTGGTTNDESLNFPGTLENGAQWDSGLLDGGITFDGVNDHVLVSHNDAFNYTGNNLTVALWAKRTDLNMRNMRIINKHSNAHYRPSFAIGVGTTGNFGSHFYSTDGRWIGASSDTPTTDTEWHHYAVVYDFAQDTAYFYVDGLLAGQNDLEGAVPSNGTGSLYIGSSDQRREAFAGSLDDVRLYNSALSEQDISQLVAQAQPPAPTDTTPPTNTLTFVTLHGVADGTGSTISSVDVNGQTADLNGNDWSITLPVTPGTNFFDVIITEDSGLQLFETIVVSDDLTGDS